MVESPNESSSLPTVTRYAPPNQRSRPLTKRKSGGGDKFERIANNYGNDGEKNLVATSRNTPSEYGGAVGSNIVNYNSHVRLIPLQGCCKSEAPQILHDRWKAAMNALNDPSIDFAVKPVMYLGSTASAWGNFRLPHQSISPTTNAGSSGAQRDFLGELRRAIRDANASASI